MWSSVPPFARKITDTLFGVVLENIFSQAPNEEIQKTKKAIELLPSAIILTERNRKSLVFQVTKLIKIISKS